MMGRTHHSNCRSCEKTVDTIDAVQLLHSDHLPSALPFLQKQSKSKEKAKQKQSRKTTKQQQSKSKSKAKAKQKQKQSKSKAKAKQKQKQTKAGGCGEVLPTSPSS